MYIVNAFDFTYISLESYYYVVSVKDTYLVSPPVSEPCFTLDVQLSVAVSSVTPAVVVVVVVVVVVGNVGVVGSIHGPPPKSLHSGTFLMLLNRHTHPL